VIRTRYFFLLCSTHEIKLVEMKSRGLFLLHCHDVIEQKFALGHGRGTVLIR